MEVCKYIVNTLKAAGKKKSQCRLSTSWLQAWCFILHTHLSMAPPPPPTAIQRCVYVTWRAQCVSACACLLLCGRGGGGDEKNWGKYKRMLTNGGKGSEGGRKEGREGTLSWNAPVLVQPATSYHKTSTDRWIHESSIIEMFMHKQQKWRGGGDGGQGGCCVSTDACVVVVVRGQLADRQLQRFFFFFFKSAGYLIYPSATARIFCFLAASRLLPWKLGPTA